MKSWFKIEARNSTVTRELVGGMTTFLAMAYIAVANPAILAEAGVPFQAALTSTCLGAALMSIVMGIAANRPIALAPGMGVNAIVAYTVCIGMGVDWRVAMSVVFVEGIVILALVLCGLRRAIMEAMPAELRLAIGIGVGMLGAFIGLKGGGLVASDAATFITLGILTSPACIVSLISIVVAVVLHALRVPGSLLISIAVATIVGIPLGVSNISGEWSFGLDFSAFAAPLQTDPATGSAAILTLALKPALILVAFSLLMSDFFDTMGDVIAIGRQGDFADSRGEIDGRELQPILIVDSVAAAAGGFMGASSITVFVESVVGAAAGARTGLSSLVVGLLFALLAFLAPFIGMVSGSATCGALVVVGYLMMSSIGEIDWRRIEVGFPAFLIVVGIPFTYSIADGIGLGFVSYVAIMALTGRAREVKPLMWVAGLAFLLMFAFG